MSEEDFLAFREGDREILENGMPPTVWFALSTRSVADFDVKDTLAGGGIGEVTGATGYKRVEKAVPAWSASWSGSKKSRTKITIKFEDVTWSTFLSTDWPDAVRSVLLTTAADNTGKAVCAWNLREGGKPRNMSGQFTSLRFDPNLEIERAGER